MGKNVYVFFAFFVKFFLESCQIDPICQKRRIKIAFLRFYSTNCQLGLLPVLTRLSAKIHTIITDFPWDFSAFFGMIYNTFRAYVPFVTFYICVIAVQCQKPGQISNGQKLRREFIRINFAVKSSHRPHRRFMGALFSQQKKRLNEGSLV